MLLTITIPTIIQMEKAGRTVRQLQIGICCIHCWFAFIDSFMYKLDSLNYKMIATHP
jgi:Na+/melibiose symporter-like transporter